MTGQTANFRQKTIRLLLGVAVLLAAIFSGQAMVPLSAASGERTLYLYYTHTKETKRITFRRNGRYVQSGLDELNTFLRDWRRNEPTKMDPALFDLLWQVYQDVGATSPINIVSAYRSPRTNEMLRSRSGGVAKNSRHTMGMAIDFFIPGIPVSKLREAAMRRQVGGVGYYPTSGSPFVHLDTGNVRAWPRMTRAQLTRLFPDGRTLHLPSDGVPISQEGRRYATNEYAKCGSIPCVGNNPNTFPTRGGGDDTTRSSSGRTLLDLFFGRGEEPAPETRVADAGPVQRSVTSVPVTPPTPAARADFLDFRDTETPPVPATMPQSLLIATRGGATPLPDISPLIEGLDPISVASIQEQAQPTPRILLTRNLEQSSALTAYAPVANPEPDAQRALQMLIERRNSADAMIAANPVEEDVHPPQTTPVATPTPSPALRGSITTASLGPTSGSDAINIPGLFQDTWDAVTLAQPDRNDMPVEKMANTGPERMQPLPLSMRSFSLVAPDLEHVSDSMVAPVAMSAAHFAVMFEPDRADFSPATELGAQSGQIYFGMESAGNLAMNRFTAQAPFIVAAL